MSELSVSTWKRYGHNRLYVNRADGEKLAWLDRDTGKLNLLDERYRDRVLDALAPYLAGTSRSTSAQDAGPPRVGTSQVPLAAEDDLAANRPGEAMLAKLNEVAPGLLRLLASMPLGRRSEAYGWRRGLAGERKVGAELERLVRKDWRVLHSIPLPRDVDIDHLLIGPGGVFCINTKHHRGARIWVGEDSVKIGGQSYPYVRKSRAEARRASSALTRACGFPVDVRPVLAFVGVEKLTVAPTLHGVHVVRHKDFSAFKRATGVWVAADVERIYAAARSRRTWLGSR
ncbi:nuclease-related domain-containing protein [Streptomyces sp. ACA25]|uniref:nuclease-related domain-containing protein n=1 Tax=Streptomyces sp. ACA25 TaxID=3022596 RepID=UPI00230737A0|nr:nuclease-related domain-containing protein [Streptomyces sp. ACA25]MDB1086453.1 nuclease-related domain-containing protein [Streptomyces sp. ACA25]